MTIRLRKPENFFRDNVCILTFHSYNCNTKDGDRSNTQTFTVIGCTVPGSGDWNVTSSCTLAVSSIAPANVIVPPNSVLTIPNEVTLTIHFTSNHLLVQPDGKVLIQPNGKLSS